MKKTLLAIIRLFIILALTGCGGGSGSSLTIITPASPGWVLTFSDEFNGTTLDTTKWATLTHSCVRTNGAQQELQGYDASAITENGGLLHIQANNIPTTFSGTTYPYTSGIINSCKPSIDCSTCTGFQQKYGYFEMRAKFPPGTGMWPAFWMLRKPVTSGQGNGSEEIDVMEWLGQSPTLDYVSYHNLQYSNYDTQTCTSNGADLSKDFHTYAVDWKQGSPDSLTWYLDGIQCGNSETTDLPTVPMFVMANLAISSGAWGAAPNASTVFPATMGVDYIRVYQRSSNGAYATIPGPTPIPALGTP